MAAHVGISSLPAEVLRRVFECSSENQRSSNNVAPFLRVCRQWKVRAMISFTSTAHLTMNNRI
jgi:hypothetical protein